jgi:hypothetical protein
MKRLKKSALPGSEVICELPFINGGRRTTDAWPGASAHKVTVQLLHLNKRAKQTQDRSIGEIPDRILSGRTSSKITCAPSARLLEPL